MSGLGQRVAVQEWKCRFGRIIGAPRALHHDFQSALLLDAAGRCGDGGKYRQGN
jgi:hypothetical protein